MNEPMLEKPAGLPARDMVLLCYVLWAVGFLLPVVWLVAVILNYLKRDAAAGSWLESHYRWQLRTFWFGLLWCVVGGILALVLIGWAVLAANYVWLIYRVVKGWLEFSENRPMYRDSGSVLAE